MKRVVSLSDRAALALATGRSGAGIVLVAPTYPPERCGVGDHTARLTETLAASGLHVDVYTTCREGQPPRETPGARVHPVVSCWRAGQMWSLAGLIARERPTTVFLQYVPFLYARRGVGVAAPLLALLLRLRGLSVVTVVHEPYVPLWGTARQFAAGIGQRLMLVTIMLASARVAVTTNFWTRELRRWLPWYGQRIRCVPVGSNIPLVPLRDGERAALRARLGITPETLMLAFFGSLHQTKLLGLSLRSVAQLRARGARVALLVIGQEAGDVAAAAAHAGVAMDGVICTGYSDAAAVSRYLQCADLFLAPLLDGVSTRRTTVTAALHHGLPVVTTAGRSTDHSLFAGALAMTPCDDDAQYVRAVAELVGDPAARRALGQRGRALYERAFTWPLVARQLGVSATFDPATYDYRARGCGRAESRSMLTVLFIDPFVQEGGAEVVLRTTLRYLPAAGVRPIVVFLSPGPLVAQLRALGVRVYVLPQHRRRHLARVARAVLAIAGIVWREKATIIHSNGFGPHLYGSLAGLVMRRPTVWQIYDPPTAPSRWHALVNWASLRLPATHYVFSADATRDAFLRQRPTRHFTMLYPVSDRVDPAATGPGDAGIDVRARFGLARSARVVLMLARLQPTKGHETLLRAAPLVLQRFPEVHFVIVGASLFGLHEDYGRRLPRLAREQGLADRVLFTGFCDDDTVRALLFASEMLVHPATAEPFGLAITEAMAAGKPVVATRVQGPAAIVVHEQTGLLVDPDDADGLAVALCRLLADPQAARAMGQRGRERARQLYTVPTLIRSMTALYRQLAAGQPAADPPAARVV